MKDTIKKQTYKLTFVTGFTFNMDLTEQELYDMIRKTKLCGYNKMLDK